MPHSLKRTAKLCIRAAFSMLLCVALLLPMLPVDTAKAASDKGVAQTSLILRAQASSSSQPLGTINAGQELVILEYTNGWYRVRIGSQQGYVKAQFVWTEQGLSVQGTTSDTPQSSTPAKAPVNPPATTTNNNTRRSDMVLEAQQALKTLGYFSGEATGYMGDATVKAITAFQKDNGLTRDGILGDNTMAKLRAKLLEKNKASDNDKAVQEKSGALKEGDENSQVTPLQTALQKRGFYDGNITGFFGSQTKAALMNFQTANGLTADGIADNVTLEKLYAQTALKKGVRGDEVKQLQQLLIAQGYLQGTADGIFSDVTEQALIAFQKASGLTADGIAGPATMDKLQNVKKLTSLKEGDKNEDVKKLQQRLIELKYLTGKADGVFGSGTTKAVTAFQMAAGITCDGIAGITTQEKLYASSAPVAPSTPQNEANNTTKNDDSKNTSTNESNTTAKEGEPQGAIAETQTKGNVVLEDWWSGVINKKIARGSNFSIKFVSTGETIDMYRKGGTNHLDAEPLTAKDTEVLRRVAGGDKWTAVAIYVIIDGQYYAAAMNSMPHGVYSLKNNNFDGHLCIHFLNSRTHGTNSINKDMQNKIMKAFNAG